jgi:pyruvyl transferase EpsO
LREALVRRFPNAKFVILPQSVHFESPAAREAAERCFGAHNDLYLYVRDHASMPFVEGCGGHGEVAPDMAHFLWGELAAKAAGEDGRASPVLFQGRTDIERVGPEGQDRAFDWNDLVGLRERALLKLWQAAVLLDPLRLLHGFRWLIWREVRGRLIGKAVTKFSSYEEIHTDRLHGLILACLLSKRVIFRDNSYKKLRRYYDAFLKGSGNLVPFERECAGGGDVGH